MRLKKRTIILIPTIVFILILVIGSLLKNTFVSLYLHDKYDMPFSQIEMLSYDKSHFKFDYGLDSSNSTTFFPKKWTIEYKDKVFVVQRYWFHFVDDYQLEDIDVLVTKKLQKEIDEHITHIVITSDMIYHSPQYKFNYKLPYSDHKLWTEKNIDSLFNSILENEDVSLFYRVDDIDKYIGEKKTYSNYGNKQYDDLKKEIENKLEQEYGHSKITLVLYDCDDNYGRYAWGDLFDCSYYQIGLSSIEMNEYPLNVVMKGYEK